MEILSGGLLIAAIYTYANGKKNNELNRTESIDRFQNKYIPQLGQKNGFTDPNDEVGLDFRRPWEDQELRHGHRRVYINEGLKKFSPEITPEPTKF